MTDIGSSANGANQEIIRFENASLGYGSKTVLENIGLSISAGDFIGVVGPNGSGKTSLLKSIIGVIKPARGRIVRRPGMHIGYVVQRQTLDSIYPFSVGEVVEMGRYGRAGIFRRITGADRDAVEESLAITGMSDLRDAAFRDLSGGQKQRALIARALAASPDVMLLDEPTNDLDIAGEATIMDLIHDIHHDRRITVIMVSHLLHVVLNHVETLLFLRGGGIETHPISHVMEIDFLSRLYGHRVSVEIVNGRKVIIAGGIRGNSE